MNEFDDVEYAGFWIRVGASLIDSILIGLVTFPLLVSMYGMEYFESEVIIAGPGDFIVSWILPAIAVILFWHYKSATPGKMLLSIKIVDAKTGGKPSTKQLIGRYFAYFVSAIPFGLGMLWVAIDKRKQGWHDKLAGTVVIKYQEKL